MPTPIAGQAGESAAGPAVLAMPARDPQVPGPAAHAIDQAGRPVAAPAGEPPADPLGAQALRRRVAQLASAEMAGREPESAGDRATRKLIRDAFAAQGLEPAFADYSQPFVDGEDRKTANVVAILPGSDPLLRSDVLVVSAHHDHLGSDSSGVFLGANDDASGVAVLLAVSEVLARRPQKPKRTVVFAAFGAEEVDLDGSRWYLAHPPKAAPLADTLMLVNLDMLGTYGAEDCVFALDVDAGTARRAALDAVLPRHKGLTVDTSTEGESGDQVSFCKLGVPGTFFHTPDPACHHKTCDTAERIDYDHMARIAALVADYVGELADGAYELRRQRAKGCTAITAMQGE